MTFTSRKMKPWTACAIGLLAFAAGSLVTARLTRMERVAAASDRVFELRVYHAVPGKLPALVSRFRDKTSKILARHHLDVIGYWTSDGTSAAENSFIWVVAYPSYEEGKKSWAELGADPEFQEIIKAEQAERLAEKVDVTYMRPADFSSIK